ncbi:MULTISPECIES: DUF4384 domain-containing protein [unclassified Bradyrhizobium]|uniref:DUF4384 domain-containing protein n=1 Tax=unclassified Bradyrhizobium TaxID=2631580 RepID=UPI00201130EA|nr:MULTISPECIES: DUF4384 domain-containing protein [unclassified Bradyrhizobium]
MLGRFSPFRRGVARIAIVAAFGMLLGGTAMRAQDAAVPVAPADAVAKAAFDMLDRNCARCHQQGRLVDRDRPAKNFGNILRLDQIAANPSYVLPGNPLGSKLFRQIADKEMPYDVNYEGATRFGSVSESDLKALEAWITALGSRTAASCEGRKRITTAMMTEAMAADLARQPAARRATTRYLTLTHLANICTDAAAMKVYRQGAVKLLNSLSRASSVVALETIDSDATILRVNLADLGWDAADWDSLLAVYPYNMQPDLPGQTALTDATRSPLPYVRADWFAFAASQPSLYHQLLRLPATFVELTRDQGVNVENDIRTFAAQRAGFQKSGVSQNNRLIERHPSRSGYFWTSYDFAGNRDRQNLFDYPLGPGGEGFYHDGGETIFSLPNGFQGYYLNKANGERLDKGPTSIVRDASRKDFTVTNGVSCMGCHDQGMRKARDEIRDSVQGSRAFPQEMRSVVEALYPPRETMDATIAADGKRFTEAMMRAGLEPVLKLNGVEMTNALFKRYEDDLDLTSAAAELGLSVKDFNAAAQDANLRIRPLIRRLSQGTVPRDQFEVMFRDLAAELTSLKPVRVANARQPEVFSQSLAQPISLTDLTLTSDADGYRQGDSPVFTIVAPRDCFLTLTDVDEKGEGTVLLPNRFQQDNRVRAGMPVQFPGIGAPFKYRMKDKGTETVVAVCAIRPDGGDAIRHDFTRDAFTAVPDYTAALSRAIAVVPVPSAAAPALSGAPKAPPAASGPLLPDASRGSFRAAIKLQVR